MHFDSSELTDMQTGMVIRKNRGQYLVQMDGHSVPCAISSRLRKTLIYPTAAPTSLHHRVQRVDDIEVVDPIAVGDSVLWIDAGDGTGVIHEVLPRKSQLSRRAAGKIPIEQVLVANVDQVVIVFAAAKPEPKWGLLDRYLVTAESANLPALICMTKLDLIEDEAPAAGQAEVDGLYRALDLYRRIGYQIILTSSSQGRGIDVARQALSGKQSILMGKSGVGKSSLLNAIQPGLGLKISAVGKGEVGKGRHTTTHLEMFPLDTGGSVVDTPGMREFTLWNIPEDGLAALFPEMRPFIGGCQFKSNCQHEHEPGCAIRKAVNAGKIDPRRYDSYLKLLRE
jgi:ribosome biogenesis GTPase / thiamine phosphate phosphatase